MIRMRRLAAVAAILLVICQALFVAFFAFMLLPSYVRGFAPLDMPAEEVEGKVMRLHLLGGAFTAMSAWMCWALARSMRSGHSSGRALAVCALLEAGLLAHAVYKMEPMSASGTAVTLLLVLLCRPRGSEPGGQVESVTTSPPGAGTSPAGPGQVV